MTDMTFTLIEFFIKAFIIVNIVLVMASVEVYLERKISAWIQNRVGPNRVGPFGLLQPIADVVKLFMKEDLVPKGANKGFHKLAPMLTLAVAIGVYAVIPYGHFVNIGERVVYFGIAPNINIGVLFILAMTSIGVYGITLAGWSSGSKYSLLGGLRSAAQMISYELSMGLSLLGVILITGTLSLNEIVIFQRDAWFGFRWLVFLQPLGFLIFMVSSFAETNRTPFDLPEAEPELVGGYNTEYSGMKFGMFFLAEYANMATASAFMALLYFGGWSLPFPAFWDSLGYTEGTWIRVLLQFGSFFVKLMIFICFFIWVRWTVPRFRYDQLMHLGWKVLLPLSIINLFVTAAVIILFGW